MSCVRIVTKGDVATGNRGTYDVGRQTATLEGDVTIVRQGNRLNGAYAAVDLTTGRSTLYAAKPGSEAAQQQANGEKKPQSRVKMMLKPRSQSGGGR